MPMKETELDVHLENIAWHTIRLVRAVLDVADLVLDEIEKELKA